MQHRWPCGVSGCGSQGAHLAPPEAGLPLTARGVGPSCFARGIVTGWPRRKTRARQELSRRAARRRAGEELMARAWCLMSDQPIREITMAKRATKKAAKKKASKRELIAPRGDKRYIRRDEKGGSRRRTM